MWPLRVLLIEHETVVMATSTPKSSKQMTCLFRAYHRVQWGEARRQKQKKKM